MNAQLLSLLIIEDEVAQLQIYNDAIDQFNKKNLVQIKQTICKDFAEGEKALLSPMYDAAIIDLKLSSSDALEGKTLVEKVYQKIRIPIFIVSGSIAQIDDIPENALLRKKLRTELMSGILLEIFDIYKTGITSFLKPNGIIDQKLSEIFWNNLSSDIGLWIVANNTNTLLRYILSHFQEYLDINPDGDFEEYHPAEIYITPPIKKNPHTGDLIEFQKELYLILTPACDIVIQGYRSNDSGLEMAPIRKADKIVLAKVKQFNYKELCANKAGKLEKDKIKNFVTNQLYRYHYLPSFKNNDGFLVDFQELTSIYPNAVFNRVASISAPFIKDIISRFSNYYSRQGQPTFQQESIVTDLYNKNSTK